MSLHTSSKRRVWTVAQAKARLSEILRLSETEGPQRIGARKAFFVVSAETLQALGPARKPLGQWMIEHFPKGTDLVVPDRHEAGREIPFGAPSQE